MLSTHECSPSCVKTWKLYTADCCSILKSGGYLVIKCWRECLSLEKSFRYFSQARLQPMRNSFQTFIVKLTYLSDVFQLINKLNLAMQGGCKTILEMSDKINAFIRKMEIWKSRLADCITDMFPLLTDFLDKE